MVGWFKRGIWCSMEKLKVVELLETLAQRQSV